MEVIRYDLGKEAGDDVRALLEDGKELNRKLAVLLLEHIDLAQGQIYTYLPPGLSAKQVNDFEGGGAYP